MMLSEYYEFLRHATLAFLFLRLGKVKQGQEKNLFSPVFVHHDYQAMLFFDTLFSAFLFPPAKPQVRSMSLVPYQNLDSTREKRKDHRPPKNDTTVESSQSPAKATTKFVCDQVRRVFSMCMLLLVMRF